MFSIDYRRCIVNHSYNQGHDKGTLLMAYVSGCLLPGSLMFPVVRKIFCKDCDYFYKIVSGDSGTYYKCSAPKNIEEVIVYKDTWLEAIPETTRPNYLHPSSRNKSNDCMLFKPKPIEKEGDWKV